MRPRFYLTIIALASTAVFAAVFAEVSAEQAQTPTQAPADPRPANNPAQQPAFAGQTDAPQGRLLKLIPKK
jgi:hypothetical protein